MISCCQPVLVIYTNSHLLLGLYLNFFLVFALLLFRSLFRSLEFVRLSHSLINTVLLCYFENPGLLDWLIEKCNSRTKPDAVFDWTRSVGNNSITWSQLETVRYPVPESLGGNEASKRKIPKMQDQKINRKSRPKAEGGVAGVLGKRAANPSLSAESSPARFGPRVSTVLALHDICSTLFCCHFDSRELQIALAVVFACIVLRVSSVSCLIGH